MKSVWKHNLKLEIYGESHGAAVGFCLENFPAGVNIDRDELTLCMRRRSPMGAYGSLRRETDEFEFLSGIENEITTGGVIRAEIKNRDIKPEHYDPLRSIPRPGHADFPLYLKHGPDHDVRGGGHFSGRMTSPLTLVGALCHAALDKKGIVIAAHLYRAAGICDTPFDMVSVTPETLRELRRSDFPVISRDAGERIKRSLDALRAEGKACGSVIECCVHGCREILGSHMFYGVENVIASLAFAVPALKGIEFGDGFAFADSTSPAANDEYVIKDGEITAVTNHAGGILGGMTYGMPIIFRTALKPTPSVSSPQQSVNMKTMTETEISVKGRHDVCIGVRAVPAIEAVAALAILDLSLGGSDMETEAIL